MTPGTTARERQKSSLSTSSTPRSTTNEQRRDRRQAGGVSDDAAAHDQRPPPSEPGMVFRWQIVLYTLTTYAIVASLTLWSHYHLPAPRSVHTTSLDAPAHFSESKAMEYIDVLSEEIGYRIVGTQEHVRAEKWLESVLRQYEGWHTTTNLVVVGQEQAAAAAAAAEGENVTAARQTNALGDTQVEVWTQIGDGAHRFDFMSSIVWKKYYGMSNVVVRISDGTEQGKEHAVLLNAHLDSTLPSPGAADDGAGVAILLEAVRILTTPPRPRLRHSVILLFNNGEESLQDASHLYATQHDETRHSVRGVVNLEACGTSGPELLFQATSVPFIEAYATVPHPFGTVLANDVFSTGLILSDTDFRQFVQYGNLSGLDMAIIGNSYQYHTRSDITRNFQPGMMQHFGENVMAIIDHLATSPKSKLVHNAPFPARAPPIYFSIAGRFFFLLPADKFRRVIMGICALSNYFMTTIGRADKHFGALKYSLASLFFTVTSLFAALLASNTVALLMVHVIGKPLSWFAREWFPILLFGPPALLGIFTTQYVFASLTRLDRQAYLERAALDGLSLFFVLSLLVLSAFGIGSSYLAALGSVAVTACIALNDLLFVGFTNIDQKRVAAHKRVHEMAYVICTVVPASVGTEGLVSFLDLFVPLTGRTGEAAPSDHIVGSIVGALTFLCLPFALPMSMRMGRVRLARLIVVTATVSVTAIAVFASPALKPFDVAHPKRIFVHAVENVTSNSFWLNVGGADPDVRGLEKIVSTVHAHMAIADAPFVKMTMDDYNPDFAILYPVSNFLTPYKMRLPAPSSSSPWSTSSSTSSSNEFVPVVSDEHFDWQAGTRRLTITLRRPDLIWSVMAFDADILEWDLPTPPPQGMQRHHLKEVARHGIDQWSVQLLLRLPVEAVEAGPYGQQAPNANPIRAHAEPQRDPSKLWIDYSGLIAEAMWPQAARLDVERRRRYPSIDVLESLDNVLLQHHPEVDSMLLSVVAAVAQI